MNVETLSWVVLALAVFAANVPFFNQHLFGLVSIGKVAGYVKPLWVRLLEMLVLYFVVGTIAHLFEVNMGSAFPQGWEFYAVTVCLFLVFAYPGYVWRYLRKRKSGDDN